MKNLAKIFFVVLVIAVGGSARADDMPKPLDKSQLTDYYILANPDLNIYSEIGEKAYLKKFETQYLPTAPELKSCDKTVFMNWFTQNVLAKNADMREELKKQIDDKFSKSEVSDMLNYASRAGAGEIHVIDKKIKTPKEQTAADVQANRAHADLMADYSNSDLGKKEKVFIEQVNTKAFEQKAFADGSNTKEFMKQPMPDCLKTAEFKQPVIN